MSETDKRPAFESALRLASPDAQPERPAKRPAQVSVGAVLMVLRVGAGVLWLWSLAMNWHRILAEDVGVGEVDLSSPEYDDAVDLVLQVILVSGGIVLAIQLLLVWLVYAGVDWARILMMVFMSLSVALAAADWFTGGDDITLRTTLLTLSLDILVLLALSSRPARAWSRPEAFLPR